MKTINIFMSLLILGLSFKSYCSGSDLENNLESYFKNHDLVRPDSNKFGGPAVENDYSSFNDFSPTDSNLDKLLVWADVLKPIEQVRSRSRSLQNQFHKIDREIRKNKDSVKVDLELEDNYSQVILDLINHIELSSKLSSHEIFQLFKQVSIELKLIPLQIDDGYKTLVEIKVLRKLFGKNGQAVSRKKILMLMEQVLIFSKLNLSQNDHERICSEVFPSLVQIFVTHMGNFRDERSLPQRVAAKISSYFSANDLTQREETDLIYHNLLAILATVSDEFKIQHQQSLEVLVNSFHAYNVDYREIAENRRDRSQYKNLDYMLALMSLAETQQSLENDHSLSEMESYQQQKTVQAFLEISILRAVLEVADMMERVGFLKEGQELPLELVGIKAMVKKYFAGAGENHTHAKLVHHILNYLSDPKSEKLPKNYAYIKDLSRELGMQHFLKSYLLRKNSAFELRLP